MPKPLIRIVLPMPAPGTPEEAIIERTRVAFTSVMGTTGLREHIDIQFEGPGSPMPHIEMVTPKTPPFVTCDEKTLHDRKPVTIRYPDGEEYHFVPEFSLGGDIFGRVADGRRAVLRYWPSCWVFFIEKEPLVQSGLERIFALEDKHGVLLGSGGSHGAMPRKHGTTSIPASDLEE